MTNTLTEAEELLMRIAKHFGLTPDEYLDLWLLLPTDRDKALLGTWIKDEMTYPELLHLAGKIHGKEITGPPEESMTA